MLPSGNYRKKCRVCGSRNGRATGKLAYTASKKSYCEIPDCPIPPELMFKEALEVHHLAGKGDDEQIITCCCFCHRKLTKENRDYVTLKNRENND